MQIERVLVVDDELLMREFLSETLTRSGIEVDVAENGLVACEKLTAGKGYDLILSDIRMDGADGLQVLAKAQRG